MGNTKSAGSVQVDAVLENLSDFSHLAFTSINGMEAVVGRLQVRYPSSKELVEAVEDSQVKICALGADAEALVKYHLHAHLQPPDASTMGLVKELQKRHELEGSRILCPVPSVRGGLTEPVIIPRFLKALEDGGAEPVRLEVYVTQPGCPPEECIPEQKLLRNGDLDAILFTSTAEAQGLVHSMGSLESLQEWVTQSSTLLAAHGPFTAAGLENCLGLEVPCISQNYKSFDGVIRALEIKLSSSQQP